ncbi:hypothetical protein ACVIHI_009126 [Bradyrhizobium sp. USDA 4524]|uniref:hypothetical protein n=1 Tax=unclassified Bradyrhizobium TaxID=2631580 RepID=UPI00209FA2B2|nr:MULTISPECIES: hypothetical protein [unclassified Bradyrhizobium]MCP1846095.1 hypothetical protein [Bradyrhizobium sp. USDA 4538]MCP1907271.1 hypothetical protein [Bradyrhizobium sp. USDA 4537]MCP1985746.1 hypothetical protein [Bradyrhizobium sp. USDA 4539]
MISTTTVSVGQARNLQSLQSFADIGQRLANAVRQQEDDIAKTFQAVLDQSSPLLNIPTPIQEQFKQWDKYLRTPEEREAALAIKKKIVNMYSENSAYIRQKTQHGIDKIQLELAVKAISKTINSAQQLLSSQ